MKVVLELQDQPSNVRRVTVRHDIVIGRGADCNLRLSAPQISRRHCFLRVGRDGVSVTDLDSSNGTYVDGQRLKSGIRQPLVNGSQLSVGPIRYLIHVRDEAVSNDVLKSSSSKEQKASSQQSSEPSTIVADSNAMLGNARAMNLALERAGAASDSHEVTSDFVGSPAVLQSPAADAARQRAAQFPQVDSRSEIVDLGRQLIAAEEQARDQKFVSPNTAGSPPVNPVAKDSAKVRPGQPAFKPPAPPVEDFDAPEDLSFFDDAAAQKTVTPLNRADEVEEVFDVAEVVEELPDENIEVVDDDVIEALDVAEVVDVAEIVEVVEEVYDVADSTNTGNVMSLDDDWDDPDDPRPVRKPKPTASQAPVKLSAAARSASNAATGASAASAKPASLKKNEAPANLKSAGKQTAAAAASVAPLVPPVVAAMAEADVVEVVDDEFEEILEVEEIVETADLVEVAEVVEVVDVLDEEPEVVEVHDFFSGAEPEIDFADAVASQTIEEPQAASVVADTSNEPSPAGAWADLASEDLMVDEPVLDASPAVPAENLSEDSMEKEFDSSWLDDQAEPAVAVVDESSDDIADWLSSEPAEPELEGVAESFDVVDAVGAVEPVSSVEIDDVEVVDVVDIEAVEEASPVADPDAVEVVESGEIEEAEGSWFSEEEVEPVDFLNTPDDGIVAVDDKELNFGEQSKSDDEIDPDLQNFLKGF